MTAPSALWLRPGDIMFARHVTPRSADLLILAGQWFLGQPRYPHHVGVIVSSGGPGLVPLNGDILVPPTIPPRMVQAMPNGAEEVDLDDRYWTDDYVYVRPNYMRSHAHLDVAAAARSYVGTPYSFLDYAAITGVRLGITNGPIRRYVTTSKHMICSQLADQAMADAGYHVFTDGRLPQDVTPGALFGKLTSMYPAAIIRPGKPS